MFKRIRSRLKWGFSFCSAVGALSMNIDYNPRVNRINYFKEMIVVLSPITGVQAKGLYAKHYASTLFVQLESCVM